MEAPRWVSIAQYSVEEGVSISTIRRKIKSSAIEYKMASGRYLIKSARPKHEAVKHEAMRKDSQAEPMRAIFPAQSDDSASATQQQTLREAKSYSGALAQQVAASAPISSQEFKDLDLKLKALDARLNGLARKLEFVMEQSSELNMLVKVFEEKLNVTL